MEKKYLWIFIGGSGIQIGAKLLREWELERKSGNQDLTNAFYLQDKAKGLRPNCYFADIVEPQDVDKNYTLIATEIETIIQKMLDILRKTIQQANLCGVFLIHSIEGSYILYK